MGNLGSIFDVVGSIPTLPGGVYIVAGEADITSLRASSSAGVFESATFVPVRADEPLPDQVVSRAKLLVLEVDPNNPASLRRLSQLRQSRTTLPIIAAIQDADISLVRTLVRQGISDVAVLPFAPEELVSQILDISAKAETAAVEGDLAPMFTVLRSTGGSGATSVVTHLAAALAQAGEGKKVCVVDLDVQCGEVASYLGQKAKVTVADLLEAGDRLDRDFLRSAVIDSQRGFWLIADPGAILPLENVDVDQVLRLLRLVRSEFDYVLIDLPADWTSWSLSVVVGSSEVLMVTDISIAGLRQAKRRIELLESLGLPIDRLGVVINRVERKLFKPIGVGEVRDTLNCEIRGTLAAEGAAIASAQDQGLLVTEISPKSRFGEGVRQLAQGLMKGAE